jgi:hypothetical protein
MIIQKDYDNLTREKLHEVAEKESTSGAGRIRFVSVYDPLDETAREARTYYFEAASSDVSVIAGDGRTVAEANSVWDQFRYGYHTSESVKKIFFDIYGLDPDDDSNIPDAILKIIKNEKTGSDLFKKYSSSEGGAIDEMSLILGQDFINQSSYTQTAQNQNKTQTKSNDIKDAIEYARKHLIDAPLSERRIDRIFQQYSC